MLWDHILFLAIILGILGFFWLSIWLFLANFALDGDWPDFIRTLRVLRTLLAAVPLLWLLAFGTLLIRAYRGTGEWPRIVVPRTMLEGPRSNYPASIFGLHAKLVDVLGIALILAVFAFPPVHAALLPSSKAGSRRWLALFALSLATVLGLYFMEIPRNGLEWLSRTR